MSLPKHFSDDQVALLDRYVPIGKRDPSQKFVIENRDAYVDLERFYQHPVDGTVIRLVADEDRLVLIRNALRSSNMEVVEEDAAFGAIHWFTVFHRSGAKASVGVELI